MTRDEALLIARRLFDGPRGSQNVALVTRIADTLMSAVEAENEACARLHESVDPACDHERPHTPGSGAMGAVIAYRDLIRARYATLASVGRKVGGA